MGLEQVIQEVRRGGDDEANAILEQARGEANELLAAAKSEAQAYQRDRERQAVRDIQQLETQAQSHAEFEARKLRLIKEAELRERLREQILEGLADLGANTRKKHVTALVKRAQEVVEEGRLWGAKKDEKALKAEKRYKFAGTTDIAGGIVVESADGTIRLDLSYESLLDDMWRDVLKQEAELFQ